MFYEETGERCRLTPKLLEKVWTISQHLYCAVIVRIKVLVSTYSPGYSHFLCLEKILFGSCFWWVGLCVSSVTCHTILEQHSSLFTTHE